MARADLRSESSDEYQNPDPTVEARLRGKFEQSYVLLQQEGVDEATVADRNTSARGRPIAQEDVYSFRLFATPTRSGFSESKVEGMQRIALKSPSPARDEPGFVNPQRADTHYFTGNTSAKQTEQYRKAAVSAEQLLQGLKTKWVCESLCISRFCR